MKERSGYAGRNGDQVTLSGEDLDLTGAGEFRKVDGTSRADAGGALFIGGNGRELWEQFARVDEQLLDRNSRRPSGLGPGGQIY